MNIFERALGSLFIGTFFSSIIYGIISIQAYFYYTKFRRDPIIFRLVIGLLWVMQGFQVSVVASALYRYVVTAWVDFLLLKQIWEFSYYGTHAVLTPMIVQVFLVYRLWSISKSRLAVAGLGLLITGQFAMGMIAVVHSYHKKLTEDLNDKHSYDLISWVIFTGVTDTAIAIALTILLRRQRTGFKSTDTAINLIMAYGVQTSAVTSVLALIILFTYAVGGYLEVLLLLGVPSPGIYIICLMANLHTRSTIRARMESATASKQGERVDTKVLGTRPSQPHTPSSRRTESHSRSGSSGSRSTAIGSGGKPSPKIEPTTPQGVPSHPTTSTISSVFDISRDANDDRVGMETRGSHASGEIMVIGKEQRPGEVINISAESISQSHTPRYPFTSV